MKIAQKINFVIFSIFLTNSLIPIQAFAYPNAIYSPTTIAPLGSIITVIGQDLSNANNFSIRPTSQPPNFTNRYSIPSVEKISDTEIRLTLPTFEMLEEQLWVDGGFGFQVRANPDRTYEINIYDNSPTSETFTIDLYRPDPYTDGSGKIPCSEQGYFTISTYVVSSNYSCQGIAVVPEGVTTVGNSAFYDGLISEIQLPTTLTTIADSAFSGATNLESADIPNSVRTIGSNAFNGTGLYSVRLLGPNVTLGNASFAQMRQLNTVEIGSGVTDIPNSAFYNNFSYSITSLTLGNNIRTIGFASFVGAGISTLDIPNSVTEIGERAFENTASLISVNFGANLQSIGPGAFQQSVPVSNLTEIVIPDSVTEIGSAAFYNRSALTRTSIGEGVLTVGPLIFLGTNLNNVNARVYYCGANAIVQNYDFQPYPGAPACAAPDAPTIGSALATGPNSASVTFTAPTMSGGASIASYEISVWDENLSNVIRAQSFAVNLPNRGQAGVFAVSGLTKSSTYRFKIVAVNSQGPSTDSAATNSVTTPVGTTIPSAPTITQVTAGDRSLSVNYTGGNSGGGTITNYKYSLNGGSFIAFGLSNPISINNLAGYQNYSVRLVATNEVGDSSPSNAASAVTLDFAQDKARKDARELGELLSLVPSIAGLSQSIAGLSNSLLLPKKCVKGKLVKNVKAGAKCPKGYKVRK